MANRERCKYCGYQETQHKPEIDEAIKPNGKRCGRFVSTFRHKRGCPKLGCDGDCDVMIMRARAKECSDRKMLSCPRYVFLLTPFGILAAGD